MKSILALVLFLLIVPMKGFTQTSMLPTANSMTAAQVWTALTSIDSAGNTMFGKCKVLNATACASCACDYYFRSNIKGSYDMYGWPKNPSSGDSTGCLGSGCWGGYTPSMCSGNIQNDAKAILVDALNKNACGNPIPPVVKGGVTILDGSKFFFVDPSADCAKGKILCGTIGLGGKVGTTQQFTRLPDRFCNAAFGVANKAKQTQAKMITCAQLSQNSLSNEQIQQAASLVGHLNASYGLFELAGIAEYLMMNDDQLKALKTQQVALYYVIVDKNSNKLPNALQSKIKTEKFDETNPPADRNYIIRSEITAAEAFLELKKKGIVVGQNLSVEQALALINSQQVQISTAAPSTSVSGSAAINLDAALSIK